MLARSSIKKHISLINIWIFHEYPTAKNIYMYKLTLAMGKY